MKQISEQRMWMINAVTQCILFLFAIILIGITGDYVNKHHVVISDYCSSDFTDLDKSSKYPCTKYQLHQAQLAFAILMLFSAILYIGLFLYLYFVVRSFSSSLMTPVDSSNKNNNQGVQQHRSWWPAPPSSQLPPNNTTSMAPPIGSVLQEIKCPHCDTIVPLPVPKETYIPTEHLYYENSSVQ